MLDVGLVCAVGLFILAFMAVVVWGLLRNVTGGGQGAGWAAPGWRLARWV